MFVQLPLDICKKYGVKLDNEPWYKNVPKLVEKCYGGTLIILKNQPAQTDRAIPNNEPDILTCKGKSECVTLYRH